MSENLMIAHREWATRPPDQRFQSLDALQVSVEARRSLSQEVGIETKDEEVAHLLTGVEAALAHLGVVIEDE